jgi:hypothetical protein
MLMLGTPAQSSEPERISGIADRVSAIHNRVMQWIPPKARLAVLTGSLVLIGLALYTILSGGSATLNLVCRQNLQSANLEVSIDGKLSYTAQLSGSPIKRFGFVGKRIDKTFSKSLGLPSGEHVVQVHLSSAADGFDQTKTYRVSLQHGKESTLLVATHQDGMSLAFQGPPVDQAGFGSNYLDSVRSILVTLVGSAVSAGIGFVVQDFLRSRKAT